MTTTPLEVELVAGGKQVVDIDGGVRRHHVQCLPGEGTQVFKELATVSVRPVDQHLPVEGQ